MRSLEKKMLRKATEFPVVFCHFIFLFCHYFPSLFSSEADLLCLLLQKSSLVHIVLSLYLQGQVICFILGFKNRK